MAILLPEILSDSVTAYIESTITLKITNPAWIMEGARKCNVTYYFGSQSGTIAKNVTVGADATVSFTLPASFYNEIPNALFGTGTIHVDSYNPTNNAYLGYTTTELTAKVNESISKPTIPLPHVVFDARTNSLTGNNSTLIRYVSTAVLTVDPEAKHAASIAEIVVTNGGQTLKGDGDDSNEYVLTRVESNAFHIQVTDTRGLKTSITYTVASMVDYVKLTCNGESAIPDTDGKVSISCRGNYFQGSFGAVSNELKTYFRYQKDGGVFSEWITLGCNISSNTYSGNTTVSGLDYRATYVFEFMAQDVIGSVTSTTAPVSATPVFHWGADDFVHETPVDFRAGILFNGVESDFIVAQGTSGIWTYRKWSSGFAECWGVVNKTLTESDWEEWGELCEAEMVTGHAYPFTFKEVPREFATLHGNAGGFIDSNAWGMSTSTTGSYWVVRPHALTGSYGYNLDLYIAGRWK